MAPSLVFEFLFFALLLFIIILLYINIKSRRSAEIELQSKNDLLERILNCMPNILYIKDSDGRLQLVNKAFSEFNGHPPEKLLGKNVDDILIETEEIENIKQLEADVLKNYSSRFVASEKITNPVTGQTHWFQTLRLPFPTDEKYGNKILAIGNEITRRKKIEQELREERNFVNAVLNTAGALIVVLNSKGEIVRFNNACEELTGYSFEEVAGKQIWELLIPADERADVIKIFDNLNENDFSEKQENHWLDKDGNKRLISWSNTLLSSSEDRSEYVIVIGQDITARRRAERALARSEEKFRSIFEHTGTALVVIEDDGVISEINEEFESLSGYSRSEVVNKKPWTDFIHESEIKRMSDNYRRRKENSAEVKNQYDFKFVNREGTIKDVHITVSVFPGTRRVVASLLDISGRKQMEEKIKKSEKRFRTIVDNAPGVVFRCLDDEDWTMKLIGPKIQELSGYPPEDFIDNNNRSYASIVHPEDLQKIRAAVQSGQYDLTYRIINRTGDIRWVRESGQVVSYPGNDRKYIDGIILDITRLKETQEKLEQSLADKDTLLKETHHRVKNNLFVVVSLLEMQAMRTPNKRVHTILQQSVDRIHAMALIHEKLYRSHSLDKIDFRPYLEELTTDLLATYAGEEKRIKIDLKVADTALVLDQAIPCGLVVNEIVANSLEHAFDGDGGKIELIFEETDEEEQQYRLAIQDNGRGLPRDFNIKDTDSLGLKLVSSLSRNQLGGSFKLLSLDRGCGFEIKFQCE